MAGPGLTALLAAIDRFDALLINDTSRLSRRLADASDIFERLQFAGKRVIAVSQRIDSSNEQAGVLLGVHGVFDQLLHQRTSQENPSWAGGGAP